MLIQFPDELCERISKGIDSGKLPQINLVPGIDIDIENGIIPITDQ